MDKYYSFVYKGILTEASLDKVGRLRHQTLFQEDYEVMYKTLGIDFLDEDFVSNSQKMSVIFIALNAFENSVRKLVVVVMAENIGETWWDQVPEKIRRKVEARKNEEDKFKWHGSRGQGNIFYCDFGDLFSIIQTNWGYFEHILSSLEWAKQIIETLEKSRNIVMHSGNLEGEDIERIGMNIRDWIRQVG